MKTKRKQRKKPKKIHAVSQAVDAAGLVCRQFNINVLMPDELLRSGMILDENQFPAYAIENALTLPERQVLERLRNAYLLTERVPISNLGKELRKPLAADKLSKWEYVEIYGHRYVRNKLIERSKEFIWGASLDPSYAPDCFMALATKDVGESENARKAITRAIIEKGRKYMNVPKTRSVAALYGYIGVLKGKTEEVMDAYVHFDIEVRRKMEEKRSLRRVSSNQHQIDKV